MFKWSDYLQRTIFCGFPNSCMFRTIPGFSAYPALTAVYVSCLLIFFFFKTISIIVQTLLAFSKKKILECVAFLSTNSMHLVHLYSLFIRGWICCRSKTCSFPNSYIKILIQILIFGFEIFNGKGLCIRAQIDIYIYMFIIVVGFGFIC